jgi:hypothetical protein
MLRFLALVALSALACRSRDPEPHRQAKPIAVAAPSAPADDALKVFGLEKTRTLRARPGDRLKLLDAVPVAELPDDDPLQRLGDFRFVWRQESGAAVELADPVNPWGAIQVPPSAPDGTLVFAVTIGHAAATTKGTVLVTVQR